MTILLALQLLETAAILIGVGFALIQLRQLYVQRRVQAGAELLKAFQTEQFARGSAVLLEMPDDLSRDEVRAYAGDDFASVIGMMAVWEGVGPLLARGEMPLELFEDYFSGYVRYCWRKLGRFVREERAHGGNPLFMEWFQWLAERMETNAPACAAAPAFERFATWRGARDYPRLRAAPSSPVTDHGAPSSAD